MNFWLVNQKQTAKHKGNERYLWCPKNQVGKRIHPYYENMRRIKPGDIILAHFDGGIQGYGTALTYSYSYPRPPHYDKRWYHMGWRCEVWFEPFERAIPTKPLADELVPLALPKEAKALDHNGECHEGAYLSKIAPEFVELIAHKARHKVLLDSRRTSKASNYSALASMDYKCGLLEVMQEKWIELDNDPDTIQRLLQARYGTGFFRKEVVKVEKRCRITNELYSHSLNACHIKPWRESSDEERLDGSNGLILAPNAFFMFKYGLFSFHNDGTLLRSRLVNNEPLLNNSLLDNMPQEREFSNKQQQFLNYHRNCVLLEPVTKWWK